MSAYVKTENVTDWVGLWMRIDGPDKTMLRFDNMQNRPINGTTDWEKYDIVLDVPKNSIGLFYGILMKGKGQAWMDGLKLELVSKEFQVTGINGAFDYYQKGQYKDAIKLFDIKP